MLPNTFDRKKYLKCETSIVLCFHYHDNPYLKLFYYLVLETGSTTT